MRSQIAVIFIFMLSIAFLPPDGFSRQRKPKVLTAGIWGGQHISLQVKKDHADIQYDCASGTIDEPIILDRRGGFVASGTHSPSHGGPTRADESDNSHPARYTGRVEGQTMKMTVTRTDTNETIGTFTLTQGKPAKIVRCL